MEREEREDLEQPRIVIENVDGDLDDGDEYDSDWSLDSSDDDQEL